MHRPITLLWALRSPCPLGCRYCYYGTVDEHRLNPPTAAGQLSHLSTSDLTTEDVLSFAATIGESAVGRLFLSGGEPLVWPPILDVLSAIKDAGTEVVVCTNGIPLNRPVILEALTGLPVDAVSVSLDSIDAAYNDAWRPSRNGRDGWGQVVSGIRALVTARGQRTHPKVGIYAVITRGNIDQIPRLGAFAAELGCDYYVPQPIALAPDHALHRQLSLREQDIGHLDAAFTALYSQLPAPVLPQRRFPSQVIATIRHETGKVTGCFGGHTLFFIQPDGSVWDCPSSLKIAATPPKQRRNIRTHTASELFSGPDPCPSDCSLFSRDCVNMWPLMDFGRITEGADR